MEDAASVSISGGGSIRDADHRADLMEQQGCIRDHHRITMGSAACLVVKAGIRVPAKIHGRTEPVKPATLCRKGARMFTLDLDMV
jgi:hypothetical protein